MSKYHKYIFLVLSLFLIGTISIFKVDAITNDLPLFGRVIFVDPGHPSYLFPNVEI